MKIFRVQIIGSNRIVVRGIVSMFNEKKIIMNMNDDSSNITVNLVVKFIIMVSFLEHASQPPFLLTSRSSSGPICLTEPNAI